MLHQRHAWLVVIVNECKYYLDFRMLRHHPDSLTHIAASDTIRLRVNLLGV